MKSTATTVAEYLQQLPANRRLAVSTLREVILANLPAGYEECMSYGMIGYVVPHHRYPAGYHCNPSLPLPYANLGSQKHHLVLHVMTIYGDPATEQWLRQAWLATGKKLDMGKGCLRFKTVEDMPLAVIGELIARVPVDKYIARIAQFLKSNRKPTTATRPKPAPMAK